MNMPAPDIFTRVASRHFNVSDTTRQPLCGQRNSLGTGWAGTKYTTDYSAVTCMKCKKGMLKRGWMLAACAPRPA